MKIEDEILQTKPFANELQKLAINISVTNSWFQLRIAEQLKPFGLSPHQFNVLRILRGRHPDSYNNLEITKRMVDKSSNATRIVDKLVQKKLVDRTENLSDRRQVDIRISERGLNLINQIDSSDFAKNMILKNFNEEKAKLINEWLDELRE